MLCAHFSTPSVNFVTYFIPIIVYSSRFSIKSDKVATVRQSRKIKRTRETSERYWTCAYGEYYCFWTYQIERKWNHFVQANWKKWTEVHSSTFWWPYIKAKQNEVQSILNEHLVHRNRYKRSYDLMHWATSMLKKKVLKRNETNKITMASRWACRQMQCHG